MQINKNKILKLFQLLMGGFILGLGSSLCFKAGWGADPITVLFDGLSQSLNTTIGNASIIVSLTIVAIVFFVDKKQLGLGTLLNPFAVQFGLNFGMNFYRLSLDKYANIPFLILGIVILSFGVATSIHANVGRSAYDALLIGVSEKTKFEYYQIRWIFDALFIILGIALGGKLTLGTVLSIIFLGGLVTMFTKLYDRVDAIFLRDDAIE